MGLIRVIRYLQFVQHAPHSSATPLTRWRSSLSHLQFFWRFGLVGCAAVEPPPSVVAEVSTTDHNSVSTDSSPLPFSSITDWLPSWWYCCVIDVLSLASSVPFSCLSPLHSISVTSVCVGAMVWGVMASMVTLLPVTSCPGMCLCPCFPWWRALLRILIYALCADYPLLLFVHRFPVLPWYLGSLCRNIRPWSGGASVPHLTYSLPHWAFLL